jgi:long-chain acyl-CoA synthetase
MLTNTARRVPERTAVSWGEHSISYAALDGRTDALAHGLGSLGVRPGDRVAVLMRNRPELLEAMYACFKGGFCLVPLNSRFTPDDVTYHVGDSGAAAILTDGDGEEVVGAADVGDAVVVVAGGSIARIDHDALITSSAPTSAAVPLGRDHLAWLFYTSGTTGRPKGAMLTHGNLAIVTASWLADLTPMTEADVTLHAAPLSHGAGFHALATTARGACHVIPAESRFDPGGILALMAEHGRGG